MSRAAAFRTVLFLALALLVHAHAAHAQSPLSTRRTNRTVHHTVADNLSTARVARTIETRLRQADEARADTFVLQLTGDRWRPDVVRDIAAAIRASGVRTVVWLSDSNDHRVGVGQAALGLIAGECWIHPGTRIERHKDAEDHALAPKGANLPRITEELMAWCAKNAHARGTDPLLLTALLGPGEPLSAVEEPDGTTTRLTPSEPAPSDATRVTPLRPRDADEHLVHCLDADLLVALRAASGAAERLDDMFEPRGISPVSSGPLPAGGAIAPILEKAAASLDALDREIEGLEQQISAKPRDQRVNTQGFYRDLGQRILEQTPKTRARVEACEKLLADDPEIARTPPPGTSAVGVTPDSCATRWRQAFQKRRDAIARVEKKARGFIGS